MINRTKAHNLISNLLVGFLLLTLSLNQAKAQQGEEIHLFYGSVDSAIALSTQTNKHILLDFYASWCRPCREMEKKTFHDTALIHLIEKNFIVVKLDADSAESKKFAAQYSVNEYPTLLVLKAGTNHVHLRLEGSKPAGLLVRDLKFALDTD
ncbi:MAG: thioredoxin fold domain-containing protein [Bacteroidetes bacterium]|nr:thioredoxin fold domain-containing protein [Bacteroidota bacterium]